MWQVSDLVESSSEQLWVSAERQTFQWEATRLASAPAGHCVPVLFRAMDCPELEGTHRDQGTQLLALHRDPQEPHCVPVQYMALARGVVLVS